MAEPAAERPRLAAVPAPAEDLGDAAGAAQYADVTAPGELRPVLPPWLASHAAFAAALRWRARREWHRALYHGLRSPVYLALVLFWGVAGAGWLAWEWLHWWLFPVPVDAHIDAVKEGWRAWRTVHVEHKRTAKTRAVISVAAVFAAAFAVRLLLMLPHARLGVAAAAAAGVLACARYGRPEGRRIVTAAQVPPEYEPVTLDVVTRALKSLGLAGVNQWIREGRDIEFVGPCRQDGPGWRVEANLPYGVTAVDVIDRRAAFASGLRRPLGAVWPEGVDAEHPGRLEVWVGQQDISRAKSPAWPLLKSGQADVFRPFPFAVDVRGRKVTAPLIYHNWLMGSIPRQGKTAAVRVVTGAVALDPLAEMQVHELKGTGDLDPFEPLCTRFVSGIDDDSIGYAAESLRRMRAELGRRAPELRKLPASICPEKKVTREIAGKYRKLRPLVCVIDEAQNLFAHPKHGKQAGDDAEFIIKVGPALGIMLILATQRPDKDSLPTGVSANVSIRFCLKVMGQLENDMILGTSSYKNGIRATAFRPIVDAGVGYLIAEAPAMVCRTYYLDMDAAKVVAARARILRDRAGTLPVAADVEEERDVLADVHAAIGTDPAVHWEVLAERLAERWPGRWDGITGEAISAQCRALGVKSVGVKMAGRNLQGCRRSAVEQAAPASYLAGQGQGR